MNMLFIAVSSSALQTALVEDSLEGAYPIALVNPGAEMGDITGWTDVEDSFDAVTSYKTLLPATGTHFFSMDRRVKSSVLVEQTIAIPTSLCLHVDSGEGILSLQYTVATDRAIDKCGIFVVFLAADATTVIAEYADGNSEAPAKAWEQRGRTVAIPSGTRAIAIQLKGNRVTSSYVNVYWDDIRADVVVPVPEVRTLSHKIFAVLGAEQSRLGATRHSVFAVIGPEQSRLGTTNHRLFAIIEE